MPGTIFSNINPATTSGSQLASLLNSFRDIVISGFIGAARPAGLLKGGYWIDDSLEISQNILRMYFFDGTADVLYLTVNKVTLEITLPNISSTATIKRTSNDSIGAALKLYKARITGQVLTGDVIAQITASSTDNTPTEVIDAATIEAEALENHTNAAQGTIWNFYTKFSLTNAKKKIFSLADGFMYLWGTTSGRVRIKAAATTTNHDLTLPAAQGAASTVLTNDGSGNLSWAAGGGGGPSWTKYTIGHAALQAAALTNNAAVLTLPIRGMVTGIMIKTSTAFVGTGITDYNLSVGIVGNESKYLPAYNALSAVSGGNYNVSSVAIGGEDFAATEGIKLFATSVGANLNQSSAGSVDIWVKTETLP
jgi:hypothetical protein